MNIIEKLVLGLCQLILWASTATIFGILVANTALRYSTGSSLQWASEVPELLFPWLVMSGIVLAAAKGSHITTTFLVGALSRTWQRRVAVVAWLLVAGMYGYLVKATYAMLEIVHDEKSPILQVPGSVTYACVMVGMAFLGVLALKSAIENLRTASSAINPSEAS